MNKTELVASYGRESRDLQEGRRVAALKASYWDVVAEELKKGEKI